MRMSRGYTLIETVIAMLVMSLVVTSVFSLVIATKVAGPMGGGPNDLGLSRKHILDAVDASLRRLGTDYIDLYQVHAYDPTTPLDETIRALDDCVRSGKVRYVGCSNYSAWHLMKAVALARELGSARFDCLQPQ